jgi:hypothetical protein
MKKSAGASNRSIVSRHAARVNKNDRYTVYTVKRRETWRREIDGWISGSMVNNMASVTIAHVMQGYATDAVAYAKRHFQINLDYSENSLRDIDHILSDYIESGFIDPDKLTPAKRDEFWTFCKMMGGYVGEVIIRNLGGTWKMKEIDDKSSSIDLLVTDRLEGSPPQAVWRALTEPYKSIATYYRTLIVLLGQGDQVPDRGPKIVHLLPLSDKPPEAGKEQKPWWRFW